jgi:hypothetical protein
MKAVKILLVLVTVFAVSGLASAAVITNVVRAGGASGDRTPIGVYTGTTQPLPTQVGGVMDGNVIYSDRDYLWVTTPTDAKLGPLDTPIIGSEYIRTFNSDKDQAGTVTYTVTTGALATVWLTIDDRHAAGAADNVTRDIGPAGTFKDTGFNLFVGEGGGRPMSVYAADLGPGVYVFRGQSGNNFPTIGAVLIDPSFNFPPVVEAGPDQTVYVGQTAQLSGTITDRDPIDGSYTGVVSSYWAGPAGATFTPADTTNVLDPTVTFSAKGVYQLLLQASDGAKDANDVVTIMVKDHADEKLLAWYPLDGNGNDATGSGRDLKPQRDATFAPSILGQAALLDGVGDDLVQVDPNDAIGKAINGGYGITVSCWVKSNVYDTDRGFIIFQEPAGNDDFDMRYDEAGATGGGDAVLKMGVTTTGGVRQVETANKSQSTEWQHAVMTWEAGGRIRGYVNGIEGYTAQSGADGVSAALSGFGALIVGRGGKDTDPNNSGWNGLVDDVRIYNYALPLDDPTYLDVLDLTAMGPVVASVDAGQDAEFSWRPGLRLPLAGVVTDNGIPDSGKTYEWTMVNGPVGGVATFYPADSLLTEVGFSASGVYTLQLSVNDPDAAAPVTDTVVITAVKQTCNDVKAAGLMLANDLNGDCYVDLADLAIILADYPRCNDPLHEDDWGCFWPF